MTLRSITLTEAKATISERLQPATTLFTSRIIFADTHCTVRRVSNHARHGDGSENAIMLTRFHIFQPHRSHSQDFLLLNRWFGKFVRTTM